MLAVAELIAALLGIYDIKLKSLNFILANRSQLMIWTSRLDTKIEINFGV